MDVDDCTLAGDDSSWKMSDWHWDSKAFRAKPVAESDSLSGSANCCKKRRTGGTSAMQSIAFACGGCRAKSAISFGLDLKVGSKAVSVTPGNDMATQQHQEVRGSNEDAERVHECTCQADGCSSDLMQQSVWHQKSRICDQHMSGIFRKQGKAQQFCQQCGRSHNPDAFDKGRRSCRTQLAKHAARRRKSNAAGNKKDVTADSNKDCTNTFRNLALAASPVTGCKAANTLAALAQQAPSTDALLQSLCDSRRNSLALNSSQLLEAEHRQTSSASDQSLVSQPNFRQLLQSAVEPTMTTQKQPPSQAYDSRLDLMLPADEKPLFQTHQAGPPAMTDELADDPLQDVLNWDLPEPTSTPFNTSSYNQAMAYMQDPQVTDQTPFQQQAPVQALYANPINSSSMLGVSPEGAYISSLTPQPYPGQSAQMPVMAAPQLNAPQQAYPSSFAAVRLSIKLFNSTPAQLPSNLRQQLTGWLNCAPASIEGYIRPGCVHLTMTAIMPSQASDAQPAPAHLRRVITQLLDTPQEHVWHNTTMLVQLGNEAAVVHQGQNLKAWSLAAPSGTPAAAAGSVQDPAAATAAAAVRAAAGTATEASINMPCCANLGGLPSRLSVLQCTQPACLIAGQQQLQSVRLEVQGWSRDCKVVCRAGGRHWEVQLRHLSAANQAGSYAIEVLLPSQLPAGICFLEVQRGSFMGPELPLLVAPTPALAQEALSLLQKTLPSDRPGLIIDLGFIISSGDACPAAATILLVRSGSQLLVRAVQHGLAKLTDLLVGVMVKERVDVLGRVRGPSGMGLIHLAVRSGHCAVLHALLQPVDASAWQATWKGPGGLTPLHLAALLPNGEAMAMQLCITFGAKQWLTAATDDGFTPAQFAIKAGKRALTQAVTSTALEQRTSVTDEAPEVIRSKPMVPSSQKRACPAESISVVPKKQKAADAWTSSTSSDNSGSSSSSGEEDSCMSEPHVFSQLSGMPVGAAQDGLVGFLQGQRQRLAALCRRSGWTPFNVGSVQW